MANCLNRVLRQLDEMPREGIVVRVVARPVPNGYTVAAGVEDKEDGKQ